MELDVRPVAGKRDLDTFIKLPWRLYRNEPHWVPPLLFERRRFFDRERNPFFEHAEAEYFLARRDGRVVGRISAHIDRRFNEYQQHEWGMFGFFECEDDAETAQALLDTAERWLRERGRDRMVGPMDFTTNDECGVLIEGHDMLPTILTNWHHRYYPALIEGAGLTKAMDLYMWSLMIDDRERVHESIWRAAAEAERSSSKAAVDAVLRTLAAAALSAALSLGAWQCWRWASGSAVFSLREIRFTGLIHATESELLRRSGLNLGENLLRADLPRAVRAIEAQPWVASARIERRLPDSLLVRVEEHRPAALVQAGALYVLDDEGRVFKRAATDDGLDLPILTGLSRESWEERFAPGKVPHRPELQLRLLSALHLLDIWRAVGLPITALSEVRLDDEGAFTLFAHDGASPDGGFQEIRLGAADFPVKLRRLAQIRGALARRGERASRIDLDNPARPDLAAATLADKR